MHEKVILKDSLQSSIVVQEENLKIMTGRQNRSSSEGIIRIPPPRFYRRYRSITPYMYDSDFAMVGLIFLI